MTQPHKFKILSTNDDYDYRIIDLTDDRLVGIVECIEPFWNEEERLDKSREIRNGDIIGVNISGYGIYISLDAENSSQLINDESVYVKRVFRQMATYFKEQVIDNDPNRFSSYRLPEKHKRSSSAPEKEKKDCAISRKDVIRNDKNKRQWFKEPLFIIVAVCFVLLITACIIWWDVLVKILWVILMFPFVIVMGLSIIHDAFLGK